MKSYKNYVDVLRNILKILVIPMNSMILLNIY